MTKDFDLDTSGYSDLNKTGSAGKSDLNMTGGKSDFNKTGQSILNDLVATIMFIFVLIPYYF